VKFEGLKKGVFSLQGNLFEMIREKDRETVGEYFSSLMDAELTQFLGRDRYERAEGESNHRNGTYERNFTLKGFGKVDVKVPMRYVSRGNKDPDPASDVRETHRQTDLGLGCNK
jgi:transposase-like protein